MAHLPRVLVTFAAFVTFAMELTFVTSAKAEPHHGTIPELVTTFSGVHGEATGSLSLPNRAGVEVSPVLGLRWRRSELVDPRKSTLTMVVDDRVVRTVRLASYEVREEGELKVSLGPLAGGFHTVRLRSHLLGLSGSCLRTDEQETWLRVLDATEVTWDGTMAIPPEVSMARLPSLWPAATLIHLVPELEPDPETALVYLEVDALVRAWGLRPVRARHEAEGPRVVMRLGGTPSWDALADASAQVSLDKDALVLVGRTAAALRHAVRMLRSEDVRRLCAPKECFFGPFADTPSIGTFDAPKEEPSTVWRLADLGLSQGWSAKGEGEHVLRWFWKKPSTWRPLPWPEVELPLLASSLHGLGAGARVTLGFNGQTLATWELESGTKPERLVARLPKEVWNVPDWALELRVHLNLQDEYRCLVRDGDAVFLTFSPEGALRVPRDEAPRAHVDEFVRRSHGQLPRLRLDAFHDWKLMDGFAPVVASWRGHLVEQPWRLAKGRQECFAGCIELQWVDDGAGPGPVLRRGPSGKAWVDPSSDKGRPMVAVAPEALPLGLYVLPEEPLVLVVKVGTGLLDEAVTVPSFTDIDAPGALFLDGKWVPWGGTGALLEHRRVTPPDPLTLPTPVAATPLETVEQRRLRWVDFLTLGGALLALIAGGFWIRRSRP